VTGRFSAAVLGLVLSFSAGSLSAEGTLSGTATAVDGGTLELEGAWLRLFGIHVDGRESAIGWQAWLATSALIARGPVACTPKAPERWRCLTAEGSDLASLLVQLGLALTVGPAYRYEETVARAAGSGLWRPPSRAGR